MLQSLLRLAFAGILFLDPGVLVGAEPKAPPGSLRGDNVSPLYFDSPYVAIRVAQALVRAQDWSELSRYYDLSLTPDIKRSDLLDGSFFVRLTAPRSGPKALSRWLHPVPPGASIDTVEPLGDLQRLPCLWQVTTSVMVEKESGPPEPVERKCQLIQTAEGFRFVPPVSIDALSQPTTASPIVSGEHEADVFAYRPALRPRASRELPNEGYTNIPGLVQAIDSLRLRVIAQKRAARSDPKPKQPATYYQPTDEELLLSLAGHRLQRSLQLAAPGGLAKLRVQYPVLNLTTVEYPRIEISRTPAGSAGPELFALPPTIKRIDFE